MSKGKLTAQPYTAWQLLSAFWRSESQWVAFLLLSSVIVLTIFLVGMDFILTHWYNDFYNALQDYDWRGTYDLLGVFLFLAGTNIILAVYRYYLQNFLALRWRTWLTEQFLNRWLEKRGYYYLEFDNQTDNPEQRIQEDILNLTTASLSLLIGLLNAVVTFFAFIYLLWVLSNVITLYLGPLGIVHISGYLVWVAIIYSLIGTFITFKIGKPLIQLNFEQQKREANFRFSAIDLRSHAEHVALYQGEQHQKNILERIFSGVLANWYAIIIRQKKLLWFTASYNQGSVFLPLVVVLPNYFKKVFKLGAVMQSLTAFTRIQDALSFLINSYSAIAEWQAIMRRLLTFINRLYVIEKNSETKNYFIYTTDTDNKIVTKDVTILTPDGETLLKNINETFIHGKHYWLRGNSGIGKSTFVRALSGIWPFGTGEFTRPYPCHIMFIPQRAYMPLGTLQEALFFPDEVEIDQINQDTIVELLNACDLANLIAELHHTKVWSEHLSPGELQRIAFLRVLLQKPDWVILDESTSALDLMHEQSLYELVKTRLNNCSIISVGHRPSLAAFHDVEIDLGKYKFH